MRVRDEVAFCAELATVGRVVSGFVPPLRARTLAESRLALDQSSSSATVSRLSKARCRLFQTALVCQSRSLRQQVGDAELGWEGVVADALLEDLDQGSEDGA